MPAAIAHRLRAAGAPAPVARDLGAVEPRDLRRHGRLLLGGEAFVASLMDVIGREPARRAGVLAPRRAPDAVPAHLHQHRAAAPDGLPGPKPSAYRRIWRRLYPDPRRGNIPRALLDTFPDAMPAVVDVVCFRRYRSLGDRTLAEVMRFRPKEQAMIEEAARRLAAGVDPGVIPARFLIGAARAAIDRRLARPNVVTRELYEKSSRGGSDESPHST